MKWFKGSRLFRFDSPILLLIYISIFVNGCTNSRFKIGECYTTIYENNKASSFISKVIGLNDSGDYLVMNVTPSLPESEKLGISTLSESNFKDDEIKFKLRFREVLCP